MRKFFVLLTVLFIIWILLSGVYTPLIISLGIFSTFFTLYILRNLNFLEFNSNEYICLYNLFFSYIPWLLKEIFISGFKTSLIILSPKTNLNSKFSFLTTTQRSDSGKVIYANSITLTPGTVSVQIEENKILVHALIEKSIDELSDGEMDKKVSLLERLKK